MWACLTRTLSNPTSRNLTACPSPSTGCGATAGAKTRRYARMIPNTLCRSNPSPAFSTAWQRTHLSWQPPFYTPLRSPEQNVRHCTRRRRLGSPKPAPAAAAAAPSTPAAPAPKLCLSPPPPAPSPFPFGRNARRPRPFADDGD